VEDDGDDHEDDEPKALDAETAGDDVLAEVDGRLFFGLREHTSTCYGGKSASEVKVIGESGEESGVRLGMVLGIGMGARKLTSRLC
jgi:hypothetical protein